MSDLQSPILIFGDLFVSKNKITELKQKHPEANWITMSANKDSLDDIRMEAGMVTWDDTIKVIVINDLPIRKQVREFLLDLASSKMEFTRIIIWDSTNSITVDPKTKTFCKTWGDFLNAFKKIEGNKVFNNGDQLTEKDASSCTSFVQKCFKKHDKEIHEREAKLVVNIVGYDRGLLQTDVDKMAITAPSPVTARFVIDNTFPTSKAAVLYKLGNALNDADYMGAVDLINEFVESGVNQNPIAEILIKQARWQMVACYYWSHGLQWGDMVDKMMNMGKFPSYIWHSTKLGSIDKKQWGEKFSGNNGMLDFLVKEKKIPSKFFKIKYITEEPKKSAKKKGDKKEEEIKPKVPRGECIPMRFMAQQTVDFIHNKIIKPNSHSMSNEAMKQKLVDRAIHVYTFAQEKYASIRYGENPMQDLQEVVRAMTDTNLDRF